MTSRAYAAALVREAVPDFSWWAGVNVRRETYAGLVGAVLVIPQAITFAYLVGLPPEYGLYCAVFVGFAASLFGRSPMVGGPNTAVSILLCLTVMPFASRGSPRYAEYVLMLSLMVGLIQLAVWLARGAEVFRYFSPAAISGIKMGVGILLITSALDGALGLSTLTTQFFYEKFYVVFGSWNDLVNPNAALISGITVASGLMVRKVWPRAYIIAAVIIGGAVGAVIEGLLGPIESQVELLGRVPLEALPLSWPRITSEHLAFVEDVLPSAVAIAVLGLAQSLVIARDLKNCGNTCPDLHKEVFAQGLANTLSPFFSTFAGSGSFNRTSVAIDMGAHTPLSGMVGACGVAIIAWVLGPILTHLPMPAVAGALALVGICMIQTKEARRWLRARVDGSVFLVTILTVALMGLEAGLAVAVCASVGFFVAGASRVGLTISRKGDGECIAVSGNLFYASLDRLADHLRSNPGARTVLDLSRVPYCDAAATEMIRSVRAERLLRGGQLEVIGAA